MGKNRANQRYQAMKRFHEQGPTTTGRPIVDAGVIDQAYVINVISTKPVGFVLWDSSNSDIKEGIVVEITKGNITKRVDKDSIKAMFERLVLGYTV